MKEERCTAAMAGEIRRSNHLGVSVFKTLNVRMRLTTHQPTQPAVWFNARGLSCLFKKKVSHRDAATATSCEPGNDPCRALP